MKTNTKRVIKFALLITLLTSAFLIGSNQGYKKGQNDVIKNQIITNKNHDKGFYFSDYKGKINKYWYE